MIAAQVRYALLVCENSHLQENVDGLIRLWGEIVAKVYSGLGLGGIGRRYVNGIILQKVTVILSHHNLNCCCSFLNSL